MPLLCCTLYSCFSWLHSVLHGEHTCGVDGMNLHVQVNMTEHVNDKGSSLYTSQAAESYLRFPTTAPPCSDWLPCQAEAV